MRWLMTCFLLMAVPASAGHIQYLVATGNITGVSDLEITAPAGYAFVTIAESVDAIVWPVPTGCAAGQGQWMYSRVADPETVAVDGTGLEVRSDLVFFFSTSTLFPGCEIVWDATSVWELVNTTLTNTYVARTTLPALNALNVETISVCPASDVSADCDLARAAMSTLNDIPTGANTALKEYLQAAVTLKADADALITAKSW